MALTPVEAIQRIRVVVAKAEAFIKTAAVPAEFVQSTRSIRELLDECDAQLPAFARK